MKISVIGCGRLGVPYATGLAIGGHEVLGLDVAPATVRILSAGRAPFEEPGLAEAIARHRDDGTLRFTNSYDDVAAHADLHILCVGTPQQAGGELAADLSDLNTAVVDLVPRLERDAVIVVKSSVPVGTTAHLGGVARSLAPAGVTVTVVCSPDFLREGMSLEDTACPSRIVLGLPPDPGDAEATLRQAWDFQIAAGSPLVVTDLTTAEMCKTAANAFLATKVSSINAFAALCEATAGDVRQLSRALALDPRIGGDFLAAGLGWGGSCLPKDLRSLIAQGRERGLADLQILAEADAINQRRQARAVELARQACGGVLLGRRVGVWGLAFKPGVDDIRDSPALAVALAIHGEGGIVSAYDPMAIGIARAAHPELSYADSAADALVDADVLLHLTAWPEFTGVGRERLVRLARLARTPVVVDGHAALDQAEWISAGWAVESLGRAPAAVAVGVGRA
ncbi:UDP-glucose/GDP-mannose dehydrogenase family protein [Sphaerisporangium sp. NPDC051017]|uniref:UDP-glucose dehydrogenase family protein n=1 Tax=Sphaerisporangium sp. NPDC051017 TaxID=3154636 RepID=UPI00343E729F